MSLGGLSPLAFVLGLLGLGAVLALLQILRVRHREVPVATTLFWRQALEQTRARVFRQRFRHLGTWAFLLLICALLWLAFAQPRWGGGGEGRTVCVLDASAGMQRGQRFAQAKKQLESDLRGLPAERTEVVFVGGDVHTLLAPGEDALLLARRLGALGPQAAPAGVVAFVRGLALEGSERIDVRVYGDAPLPAAATLPEAMRVSRVGLGELPPGADAGITALGVAAAASGAWDAVDVLIEARSGAAAPALRIEVDGLDETHRTEETAPGRRLVRLTDLPARGQVLRVSLDGRTAGTDEIVADDVAEIVLPHRPVLRVAVDASLRAVLTPVIASDPGLRMADAEADVAVVRGEDGRGPEQPPALVFLPVSPRGHTVYVAGPDESPQALLDGARRDLALGEIDGAAIARATGEVVSVGAEVLEGRTVLAWERLLADDVGFTRSRAFPLFVAGALRWLAGRTPTPPFVAAGEPAPGTVHGRGYEDEAGRTLQPVGAAFTPPHAGRYRLRGTDVSVAAALLDPAVFETTGSESAAAAATTAPFSFATLLMLLALLLLLVEWFLFRTERIP